MIASGSETSLDKIGTDQKEWPWARNGFGTGFGTMRVGGKSVMLGLLVVSKFPQTVGIYM